MNYSHDVLDQIRDRIPISTLVGQRVTFDRKKSNPAKHDYWGCCPFHREKTPSFHCDDTRQRYHCFSCGASGDHFRFLTELDGVSFVEAVQQLAAMAGVVLEAPTPEQQRKEKRKQSLYDVMALAEKFYRSALERANGREAKNYILGRGIDPKTIEKFAIGYAPDSRYGLRDYLKAQNITLEQMIDCGLVVAADNVEGSYDRFRDRLMFPIHDLKGRIVGFGGRALNKNARAKYLNSPETVLFHKGSLLYNAKQARAASRLKSADNPPEPRPIIVVEGYMDVVAVSQAGIDCAVAPLGTALTIEQLQLLWQLNSQPILCFDGDEAGIKAAYRAIDLALPHLTGEVSLRVAQLPGGVDPDDFIKMHGPQAFGDILQNAQPISQMLWARASAGKSFTTPELRASLEKELKRAVYQIKDEGLRHYYWQDMKERLRALFSPTYAPNYGRNAAKRGFVKSGGADFPKYEENVVAPVNFAQTPKSYRAPLREALILVILINHPKLWEADFEQLAQLSFQDAKLGGLHQAMLDVLSGSDVQDYQHMRAVLVARHFGPIIDMIETMIRNLGLVSASHQAPDSDAKAALNQALHLHMRAHTLHKRLQDIKQKCLEQPDEKIFDTLRQVKQEIEETEATQALIEGFGKWVDQD